MSQSSNDRPTKPTIRERLAIVGTVTVVAVGISYLAHHYAKTGAAAALKDGAFKVSVDLPEGYEIINVAQI